MTDATRGAAVDAVAWISAALAVGSALLAVGHVGVRIPVVSALGPGGSAPVVPAAIAFAVAACLHGGVAYGVARRRPWAWPLGVLVAAVTLLGAAVPFRGAGSVVGIMLAGSELGLLLTRRIRRAILRPAS
ncbi:MAG TPA: hypothetical protein VK923_10395 [Euzebyales bacterium]|nr:hypothetical protein [Euzebyales bacterium]